MKISKFLVLCLTMLIVPAIATASGIFTLKGTLKGMTEKTYLVSVASLTYELNKENLPEGQLQTLRNTKVGQPVELVISNQSLHAVHQ